MVWNKRFTPSNEATLNKLSDNGASLLFNGSPINSSSLTNTSTLSQFSDNGTNVFFKGQQISFGSTGAGTTTSKWAGKVWNVVGDSITENNTKATEHYYDYISSKVGGMTINNYGVSGTGWFTPSAPGGTNEIYNRVPNMSLSADLITVFAGTNDVASVGKTFVLGTYGDTDQTASFFGALDYSIKQLVSQYPTKTIAVFTPLQRNFNSTTYGHVNETDMINAVNAIIQVAGRYSIPCLDLYRFGNMYAWNSTFQTNYMPDGLHPNASGHAILADKILSFLDTL